MPLNRLSKLSVVIAGLDPAIHLFELTHFLVDAQVKPAHEE